MRLRSIWTLLPFAFVGGCGGNGPKGDSGPSMLYVMTNEASNNRIVAYRFVDGRIENRGFTVTGGVGTGVAETPNAGPNDGIDPLGSQNCLSVSPNGRFLFAVNAGSGSVSSFGIGADGSIGLIDVESTLGASPVSVAASNSAIYVANVGDAGGGNASIVGFSVDDDGNLTSIPNSQKSLLTTGSRPRGIAFTPTGNRLIVSEGGQELTLYPILSDGTLGTVQTSSPRATRMRGFDVSGARVFASGSEMSTGVPLGSVSTFVFGPNGQLQNDVGVNDASNGGGTRAELARGGRFGYVSSTENGTLASYRLASGSITTLQSSVPTGLPGSGPMDLASSRDGKWLAALLGGTGRFAVYRIETDGSLTIDHTTDPLNLPERGVAGMVLR